MTILGTRPEIIRLSRVIPLLDDLCRHVLVHTGQNFDPTLNDVFFRELSVRAPDHVLTCRSATMMGQVAAILVETERLLREERPDRLLILGDTNSGLSAIAAKRLGIPVFHLEAGNRCYDDRVPEEVNRRIIDHSSDVLMPYTERSRSNLLREGIPGERIHVVGNPIREVLDHYAPQIDASDALTQLGVEARQYVLVTLHRAENVDVPERLASLFAGLELVHRRRGVPVICSVHPHTRARLSEQRTPLGHGVIAIDPLGLFDFVNLEKHALAVLTDSGTVQEECCLFGVPNATLRDVTERPETLEVGSNLLVGTGAEAIADALDTVVRLPGGWSPPPEYAVPVVSRAVTKIVLGLYGAGRA